jgi:hypothetical protein
MAGAAEALPGAEACSALLLPLPGSTASSTIPQRARRQIPARISRRRELLNSTAELYCPKYGNVARVIT